MGIAAMVSALAMVLCELLAFFGADTGGWDLAVLGLVFAGLALLFMNLPPVVRR